MKYFKHLKTTTLSVMAIIFLWTIVPQSACAQNKLQKQKQKESNQEYKKKMKEFKQGNWQISGSSRSLEVALLTHYEKLLDESNQDFVSVVTKCQSINLCRQAALNNALNQYAMLAGSSVKGRATALLRNNEIMPQEAIDKFIAGYENEIRAEVSGVLTESFSVVQNNGATNSYQTFFILNEEKAGVARQRAFERSLRETKITIKEAEEISRFVNEGVKFE